MVIPASNGLLKGNDAILRRVSMNFNIDRRGSFLSANNSDGSVRWVQDWMDDLDVRIAMRDFEEAVRSIEKGNAIVHQVVYFQGGKCLHLWTRSKSHIPYFLFICRTGLNNSRTTSHMPSIWNHIYPMQRKDTRFYLPVLEKTISLGPHTCNPAESMFGEKFGRCNILGPMERMKSMDL